MHLDLPLSPLQGTLRVWLFKDVENVRQLRESIVADATNNTNNSSSSSSASPLLSFPDASFLNASLVPDLWTLRLAAFAAEASHRRGRARARSRHTELVVALSGGKNISWALSTFGLSDNARHLVVARFVDGGGGGDKDDDNIADDDDGDDKGNSSAAGRAFAEAVKGKAVPAAEIERELASLADAEAQARAYKIITTTTTTTAAANNNAKNAGSASAAASSLPAVEVGPLPDAVACRIAVRDC